MSYVYLRNSKCIRDDRLEKFNLHRVSASTEPQQQRPIWLDCVKAPDSPSHSCREWLVPAKIHQLALKVLLGGFRFQVTHFRKPVVIKWGMKSRKFVLHGIFVNGVWSRCGSGTLHTDGVLWNHPFGVDSLSSELWVTFLNFTDVFDFDETGIFFVWLIVDFHDIDFCVWVFFCSLFNMKRWIFAVYS